MFKIVTLGYYISRHTWTLNKAVIMHLYFGKSHLDGRSAAIMWRFIIPKRGNSGIYIYIYTFTNPRNVPNKF